MARDMALSHSLFWKPISADGSVSTKYYWLYWKYWLLMKCQSKQKWKHLFGERPLWKHWRLLTYWYSDMMPSILMMPDMTSHWKIILWPVLIVFSDDIIVFILQNILMEVMQCHARAFIYLLLEIHFAGILCCCLSCWCLHSGPLLMFLMAW